MAKTYLNDGLTWKSDEKSIHSRDGGGNIQLQEGSTNNQTVLIEPTTLSLNIQQILGIINTRFEYYKFPVTTTAGSSISIDTTLNAEFDIGSFVIDEVRQQLKFEVTKDTPPFPITSTRAENLPEFINYRDGNTVYPAETVYDPTAWSPIPHANSGGTEAFILDSKVVEYLKQRDATLNAKHGILLSGSATFKLSGISSVTNAANMLTLGFVGYPWVSAPASIKLQYNKQVSRPIFLNTFGPSRRNTPMPIENNIKIFNLRLEKLILQVRNVVIQNFLPANSTANFPDTITSNDWDKEYYGTAVDKRYQIWESGFAIASDENIRDFANEHPVWLIRKDYVGQSFTQYLLTTLRDQVNSKQKLSDAISKYGQPIVDKLQDILSDYLEFCERFKRLNLPIFKPAAGPFAGQQVDDPYGFDMHFICKFLLNVGLGPRPIRTSTLWYRTGWQEAWRKLIISNGSLQLYLTYVKRLQTLIKELVDIPFFDGYVQTKIPATRAFSTNKPAFLPLRSNSTGYTSNFKQNDIDLGKINTTYTWFMTKYSSNTDNDAHLPYHIRLVGLHWGVSADAYPDQYLRLTGETTKTSYDIYWDAYKTWIEPIGASDTWDKTLEDKPDDLGTPEKMSFNRVYQSKWVRHTALTKRMVEYLDDYMALIETSRTITSADVVNGQPGVKFKTQEYAKYDKNNKLIYNKIHNTINNNPITTETTIDFEYIIPDELIQVFDNKPEKCEIRLEAASTGEPNDVVITKARLDVKTISLDDPKYAKSSPYDFGYWPWTSIDPTYGKRAGVWYVSPNTQLIEPVGPYGTEYAYIYREAPTETNKVLMKDITNDQEARTLSTYFGILKSFGNGSTPKTLDQAGLTDGPYIWSLDRYLDYDLT